MTLALYVLLVHGLDFERKVVGCLRFDDHLHSSEGVIAAQVDYVAVFQSNTSFTGTPWHTHFIVGAAMDANTTMARCQQTEKIVTIRLDIATPVAKIMLPSGGIGKLGNLEGDLHATVRCLHVTLTLFVAFF